MLGRLSRWLRLIGLDALYLRPGLTEAEREHLAQGRILITRRTDCRRESVVKVTGDHVSDQLPSVLGQLELDPADLAPFSRCLDCNLVLEPLDPDRARPLVPDYVAATETEFRRCPGCGRVFWPGSHRRRMVEKLAQMGLTRICPEPEG